MRSGSFLWACLLWGTMLTGQNLIPDGDFEQLLTGSCLSPTQAFEQSTTWYTLDATPDLFQGNCLLDEAGSYFWDADITAYSGQNFIGLASRWNSNATYVSEGIATRLAEPLQAGVTYYLQFALLNRGGYQGFDEDIASCNLRPNKHLDIYLASDSIRIENNFSNGTSSTSARLVARMNSEIIASRVPSDTWVLVSTCFEAEGGEEYLGITMPLGTFGDLPPCVSMSTSGVFRSFYYNLDAIQLTDTPDALQASARFCAGESLELDLTTMFEQPILADAAFFWEDGSGVPRRSITRGGTYLATAEIACGQIPIVLEITEEGCFPEVYVPNAFSPNRDGVNDTFHPLIAPGSTIIAYKWSIYQRWGSLVFQTNDPTVAWDGFWRQQMAAEGPYLWRLDLEVATVEGSRRLSESGTFWLLR